MTAGVVAIHTQADQIIGGMDEFKTSVNRALPLLADAF